MAKEVLQSVALSRKGKERATLLSPELTTFAVDDEKWESFARNQAVELGIENWRLIPRPSVPSPRSAPLPVVSDCSSTSSDEEFDVQASEKEYEMELKAEGAKRRRMEERFSVLKKRRLAGKRRDGSIEQEVQRRRAWTESETAALIKGVELYGKGNWTLIKSDPFFHSALSLRDCPALKDRWRVIQDKLGTLRGELEHLLLQLER